MSDGPEDQRLPKKLEGSEDLSLDVLASIGVLYWKVATS